MSKSNDKDREEQGQQDQDVNVMKTKAGTTMIQTGRDSVQIDGDNHGGIRQNFG